jgi:hypothetical protein
MMRQRANNTGGKRESSFMQPTCSCGWVGDKHYAYEDYQRTEANKQFSRHECVEPPVNHQ